VRFWKGVTFFWYDEIQCTKDKICGKFCSGFVCTGVCEARK